MGIAVLGPLTIDGDGEVLGRRDRLVLAALVVHPGDVVSADRLADLLWDKVPPPTWPKVVQGCVVRLRKRLGARAIETFPSGYRLAVRSEEIDAQRFEQMFGRARQLMVANGWERAAVVLADGLALWRGSPLTELDGWDVGRIEASRLEELKALAEELYVEACLRCGQHVAVLAKATALVGEAPLRERRWALLATAQYQTGRQGDALDTLRRVRDVLNRELGLDPGPELEALKQAILRQDPSLVVTTALPDPNPGCPYPGLKAYDIDDSDAFFGRETDVAACLDRLAANQVLAVVGPSGCGMSSLVLAGVAATLRRNGDRIVVITPGKHPVASLTALPGRGNPPVLVVDQCEEVFSVCQDIIEREQFLAALVRHRTVAPLIVSFRADRLPDVSAHPAFARALEQGLYLLAGMGELDLRSAIEGPARLSSLVVEPGLVDLLVGEVVDEPGALPLMSHVLAETWKRRQGRTLTVEGYRASGGVKGAVAQSAEEVYEGVKPQQRIVLRDLLLRLVTPSLGAEPMRSRLPRRLVVTDDEHGQMIDLLVASRLVTSDNGILELAHEALARAWPRLRGWLEDDVEGQRILHHLAVAADAWDILGRPESELYRGVRLAQALEWRERASPTLTATERDFILAGQLLSETDLRRAEQRAQHQAMVNRRLRGVLAAAAALLLVSLVAGFTAVYEADRADQQAFRAERSALSADVGRAGAKAVVDQDIDRSLLLAATAAQLEASPEARANLLAVIAKHPQLVGSLMTEKLNVTGLDVAPDGRDVALYDFTGDVVVYRPTTETKGPSFRPEPATGGAVPTLLRGPLAYSPGGDILAAGTPGVSTNPVVLLDPRTLRPLQVQLPDLPQDPTHAFRVGFSGKGHSLFAIMPRYPRGMGRPSSGAWLTVWDVDPDPDGSPRFSRRLTRRIGSGEDAVLSPDGNTVFTSAPVAAYDVTTGRRLYMRPSMAFQSLDISPDGRLLCLAGTLDEVRDASEADVWLVDSRSGKVHRRLESHAGAVTLARFSHAGKLLVSTAVDLRAIVWEVQTGRIREQIQVEEDMLRGVGFSSDDAVLYTAGSDGALRSWDLVGRNRYLDQLAPPGDFEQGCSYPSPGGQTVWRLDPTSVRFVDVATGRETPRDPWRLADAITCGTWHPSGDRFAMSSRGTIHVFDARTGHVIAKHRPAGTRVMDLDYSGGDGDRIVIGEASGRATLLDADTLRPVGKPVQLNTSIRWLSASPDGRTAILLTGGRMVDDFEVPTTGWVLADLKSGKVIRRGRLGIPNARQPWFAPDGRRVVIGGAQGEVLVLDTVTGRFVRPAVQAHGNSVQYVSWNADGSLFVSSGLDGTVSLFDGKSTSLLGTVVFGRLIVAADFESDGHTVLISTNTQAVYRWDTRLEHAVAFACRIAGRDLTVTEWRDSFAPRPHQHTCS